MSIDAYLNPDFGTSEKLTFFLMAFAGVVLCVLVILGGVRLGTVGLKREKRRRVLYERSHNCVQRFYEMIISATSIMSFLCAYVIINHIYSVLQGEVGSEEYERFATFVSIWEGWKDFVLLLLICLSCVLNTILDKLIVPLKRISAEEKATVRMLGMFYVILILLYLNMIGDVSEYSPVMLYYLGLMVGRFVYFDASFADFIKNIKNVVKNLYLLLLGLLLTGILCYIGFDRGYLLERNYYIVGAFYTHLFMLAAVFVLRHSHLLSLIVRKPKSQRDETEEEEYDPSDNYEGYEEYDDYEGYDDRYDDPEEYGDESDYEDYEEYDNDDYQ